MIDEMIKKYSISGIWHFTDFANINSIKRNGGLLSLRTLKESGIPINIPGGNDWSHQADERLGIDDFVHLAFLPNHPMLFAAKNREEGRIEDPIWLKIDPSVMLRDGVQFAAEVANKSGAQLFDRNEVHKRIDFEVLFTRTDWSVPEIFARRKAAEKSEILVPKMIPVESIIGWRRG